MTDMCEDDEAEVRIWALINDGRDRMNPAQRRIWDLICIEPQTWHQPSYGNGSGAFWVVAVLGQSVVWHDGNEDEFKASPWRDYGQIEADAIVYQSLEAVVEAFVYIVAGEYRSGAEANL